jgi:chemotaxis protein methyltransferase CheR
MAVLSADIELGTREFDKLRQGAYERAGIRLPPEKFEMVRSRVITRVRALALPDFKRYLTYLEGPQGEAEWVHLLDVLTTNVTSFFREPAHFDFLRNHLVPAVQQKRRNGGARTVRVWCAAAASGEEPYSLAIVLETALPKADGWDVRILASDISTRALAVARTGVYPESHLENNDLYVRQAFFAPGPDPSTVRVIPSLQKRIVYRRINLMAGPWPLRGRLQAIFCRNVMIYFDAPTQERLVNRFHALLEPDGYLFVGLSESLTRVTHPYRTVAPGVHQRIAPRTTT